jgi:hypothetical protein
LYAPDSRDADFPVLRSLGAAPVELERTSRYWFTGGWWGDQGEMPYCVAFAWAHWLEDGPVTQPGNAPIVIPADLYAAAQEVDEWPGTAYDGTSVRAGAKVLQTHGFVQSYQWAFSIDEAIRTLLHLGPMVIGVNWYDSMFEPDEAGFVDVSGPVAGGHAVKLDGVNTKRGLFRIKNSWGREWGNNGFAYISFEDFERLLREDGEACIAIEVKAKAVER